MKRTVKKWSYLSTHIVINAYLILESVDHCFQEVGLGGGVARHFAEVM